MRCKQIGSVMAAVMLLLAARSSQAADLTGSWWLHPDPYAGDGGFLGFLDVTFDIVQSGNTLTISNVELRGPLLTQPGDGVGTIDPVTGVFSAGYGFMALFEPVGTMLNATASSDGSSFTGEAILSFFNAPGTEGSPVAGIRLDGPPVCGNSRLEPGELCDDGNNTSNDGCSATCVREPRCGDRIRDPGEDCDDGNLLDNDGCSASCVREPRCGDGVRDPGEECDDGNDNETDTCTSSCESLTACGNSLRESGEQCDDGNTVDGDCCSALCRFTQNECRTSTGPCDRQEFCAQGICQPDSGTQDIDHDNVCDPEDICNDVNRTRGFHDRARVMFANINDGVRGNERFILRAQFDLGPGASFSDYDPTAIGSGAIIMIATALGPSFQVFLPEETYAGPGTRGWSYNPARRQWLWRDRTTEPIDDIRLVSISALSMGASDRVHVRIDGRATGHPASDMLSVVDTNQLPLQVGIQLYTYANPGPVRCGESRFTAGECVLGRNGTRLVCR